MSLDTDLHLPDAPVGLRAQLSASGNRHGHLEAHLMGEPERHGAYRRSAFIIIPSGKVSITEAATDIFIRIAESKTLFYRGGRIHEVVRDADGASRLEPITPAQFRSRIESFGTVMAWRAGRDGGQVLKETIIPEDMARAIMETTQAREILPNVATLSACPVIARGTDDSVHVLGPGWHPHNGGIFVTGGTAPEAVDLKKAVADLSAVLADFNFTTPGDRARAIASLIAPALKAGGWLKNALPIDIGEADQSQSGKTYRQKLIAAIYNERNNTLVQRSGGVGGLDESISQALIDARPFVLLDNVRGRVDSQFLEAILTAPGTVKARVPHRGEVACDARNFIWQLTSNGAESTRDLVNRASIIRIIKQAAGYKFAAYGEGDIHQHIVANQGHYLGCVFAIVQEWIANDCRRNDVVGHDFREWSGVMDWIVQSVFSAAPLLQGFTDARDRVCDPKKSWVRNVCLKLKEAGWLGRKLYAMNLAEFSIDNEVLPPGFRTDMQHEGQVARKIGVIFGGLFVKTDEITIEGFTVVRTQHYNSEHARNVPQYEFRDAA